MGKNTYQPEHIIAKKRKAEVLLSKGQTIVAIVRKMGKISEQLIKKRHEVFEAHKLSRI